MKHTGPEFYDDATVFATYQRHRARPDSPNDTLEALVIWTMLGDVAGCDILDLGCGDAQFGRDLLARGRPATSVLKDLNG